MKAILVALFFMANAQAALQVSKQADKEAIKAMTGCYLIKFQNAETFALTSDYEYFPRYASGGLEWIFVDEETENEIELQHLLVIPGMPGGGVLKHWRQTWHWENRDLYDFQGDNAWSFKEVAANAVLGEWTQKVYQVDDSPRYECSAPWVHTGKKTYWECEADAPLPRREFSVRSDYNILRRTNRHELTSFGHVHDQDNLKVNRAAGVDSTIVMEKGYYTYTKRPDAECGAAPTWWQTHRRYWKDAQAVWDSIFGEKKDIAFQARVNNSLLWEKLFALDERFSASRDYDTQAVKSEVESAIRAHLR